MTATSSSFIGDLSGDTPIGRGVYFADFEMKYQGVWSADQSSYYEAPAEETRFASFDPLDVSALEQGETAQDRKDSAHEQAYGFLSEMEFSPAWREYGLDMRYTRYIKTYYESRELGGGPITRPLNTGDMSIDTTFVGDWRMIMSRLASAAYDGNEYGGYIKINGIELEEGAGKYVDMWLYSTAGQAGFAALKRLNATDQRSEAERHYWYGDDGLM